MLYIIDDIDALDPGFVQKYLPLLSQQRREKVSAYRFDRDKKLSVAVYLLLRHALKTNFGIHEAVEFASGPTGKPFLRDYPRVHFNLSHCRTAIACAVSDSPVGVDVEEIVPVPNAVARRVLTEREYRSFLSAPDAARAFCAYWVQKESWLKKTGRGIGDDLSALDVGGVGAVLLECGTGYCCGAAGGTGTLEHVTIRVVCDDLS